jgi:uncharacterized protein YcbX
MSVEFHRDGIGGGDIPIPGEGSKRGEDARSSIDLGAGLPLDRHFAICHGRSAFDPWQPSWQRRREFLQVAHDPRLVPLDASFESMSEVLTIRQAGKVAVSAKVSDEAGRADIDAFIAEFMRDDERGPPHLVSAPGVMFTDQADKLISLIHRASLVDLRAHLDAFPDEARFRGNLIIDGCRPWQEFGWLGREIRVGEATLRIVKRVDRCAATTANPTTGERDLNIPKALRAAYGHVDCGVFGEVTGAGIVRPGDVVTVQ